MNYTQQSQLLYEKSRAGRLDDGDIQTVIDWPDDELVTLFGSTDRLRRDHFGNKVAVCAIMNIKPGGCSEDCAFCAQSRHNPTGVKAGRMADADAVVRKFEGAKRADADFCMVSTGRGLGATGVGKVAAAAAACGGPVHASLGIIAGESFAVLKKAGVVCYNHNLESSRRFFPRIVSSHGYDERIATVRAAAAAGLSVCCGGIFGVGESWRDRADLALELRGLPVQTVPLNFFVHKEGMRASPSELTPLECLKIIALFRFILPDRVLKVAGGREVHLRRLQPLMFCAGANGFITGGYLTTGGQGVDEDAGMLCDLRLERMPEA